MCRVLSYFGKPILLDTLLYKTDNSLITQSYNPKLMPQKMFNLAGFGVTAWTNGIKNFKNFNSAPRIYRTPSLPFYDENLKNMAEHTYSCCILAHIRGVEYNDKSIVSNQNLHPFLFDNTDIAFAHNGALVGFNDIRYELANYMKQEYKKRIRGTTDSEWIYALFLSNLPNKKVLAIKDIFNSILSTIDILQYVRKKAQLNISSPLNFFISNGSFLVATRYVLDYGCYPTWNYFSPHMIYHSLWYTYGEEYKLHKDTYHMQMGKRKKSIIIASEPLTEDSTTWIEIPEYSFIGVHKEGSEIHIQSLDII